MHLQLIYDWRRIFSIEECMAMDTLSESISIFFRKNSPPGIIFLGRIHPHSKESAGRDYFPEPNSSPYKGICPQALLVISSAAIAAFRMLFPVAMHPEIAFGDLADAFYIPKASMEENSSEKGCFRLGEIIPADGFLCMGMNSSRENNPWRWILLSGDEFGSGK